MQEFINYLVNNWQWITSIVISLFSFILLFFRKRYKVVDSACEYLMSVINEAVRFAEHGLFTGSKKNAALDYIHQRFDRQYPGLNWNNYKSFCDYLIEDVLNTPQKKGDKDGKI